MKKTLLLFALLLSTVISFAQGTETIDLTQQNWTNGQDLSEATVNGTNVTVSFTSSAKYFAPTEDSACVRLASKSENCYVVITAKQNLNLAKVVFKYKNGNRARTGKSGNPNYDVVTTPTDQGEYYTEKSSDGTIAANSWVGTASSVKFGKTKGNGQIDIASIEVTTETSGEEIINFSDKWNSDQSDIASLPNIEGKDFTISFQMNNKNNVPTYVSADNCVRLLGRNRLSVKANNGKVITKVAFTFGSTNSGTNKNGKKYTLVASGDFTEESSGSWNGTGKGLDLFVNSGSTKIDIASVSVACEDSANTKYNNVAKVWGLWNDYAYEPFDKDYAPSAYDLTSATATTKKSTITPTNPYCLFVLESGQDSTKYFNFGNVVTKGNTDNVYTASNLSFTETAEGENYALPTSTTITTTGATLSRALSASGSYVTLVSPFDAAKPEGCTLYTLESSTDGSDGTVTLNFKEANEIKAGTPYVVKVDGTSINVSTAETVTIDWKTNDNSIADYVLKANYEDKTLTADDNAYVLKAGETEGLNFVYSTGHIKPFRAYITTASTGAKQLKVQFTDVTGISRIATDDEVSKIFNVYSVDGRLVKQNADTVIDLPSGLYIVNGKKVLKK